MIFRVYCWLVNLPGKLRRQEGQGLVEYALILILIAFVVIGALTLAGITLNGTYKDIASQIEDLIP